MARKRMIDPNIWQRGLIYKVPRDNLKHEYNKSTIIISFIIDFIIGIPPFIHYSFVAV